MEMVSDVTALTCSKCGKSKPPDAFYPTHRQCKRCHCQKTHNKHKERMLDEAYRLKHNKKKRNFYRKTQDDDEWKAKRVEMLLAKRQQKVLGIETETTITQVENQVMQSPARPVVPLPAQVPVCMFITAGPCHRNRDALGLARSSSTMCEL